MKFFKSALCLLAVIVSCGGSVLKLEAEEVPADSASNTEAPDNFNTDANEESSTEELPGDDPLAYTPPAITSDETVQAMLAPGKLFRLKMTVEQVWSDEYENWESETFKKLAAGLGAELIDFIDNSKEAKDPNMTIFQLVKVQPVPQSMDKVYVTFIVSSKEVISGEDLKDVLSSQINIYNQIYAYNVTLEGFSFEAINKEEAETYDGVKGIFCDEFQGEFWFQSSEIVELMNSTPPAPTTSAPVVETSSMAIEKQTFECGSEKIQRGSTSIYILEGKEECVEAVRSYKLKDETDNEPEECPKSTTKRSTSDDDETVVVIRKRGNKVFIEI